MREAKFVKSLTVALPVDVYQKIKQITDDEKISMAKWVRKVVNIALDGDDVEVNVCSTDAKNIKQVSLIWGPKPPISDVTLTRSTNSIKMFHDTKHE